MSVADADARIESAVQVLDEWGTAIRGSWSSSSIDGRSCRLELAAIAAQIRGETDYDLHRLRGEAGVCIGGGGHWPEFCDDTCGGDS